MLTNRGISDTISNTRRKVFNCNSSGTREPASKPISPIKPAFSARIWKRFASKRSWNRGKRGWQPTPQQMSGSLRWRARSAASRERLMASTAPQAQSSSSLREGSRWAWASSVGNIPELMKFLQGRIYCIYSEIQSGDGDALVCGVDGPDEAEIIG